MLTNIENSKRSASDTWTGNRLLDARAGVRPIGRHPGFEAGALDQVFQRLAASGAVGGQDQSMQGHKSSS